MLKIQATNLKKIISLENIKILRKDKQEGNRKYVPTYNAILSNILDYRCNHLQLATTSTTEYRSNSNNL